MVVSKLIKMQPDGGARENRTLDLILARDALSQLSYDPLCPDNQSLQQDGSGPTLRLSMP